MREEPWTRIQGSEKIKMGRLLEIREKNSKQVQKRKENRKKVVVRVGSL